MAALKLVLEVFCSFVENDNLAMPFITKNVKENIEWKSDGDNDDEHKTFTSFFSKKREKISHNDVPFG